MKKNILLLCIATLASPVFAQNVLYSENFNSGSIPTNMRVIDEDSLAHHPSTAYINKAWKAVGGTRFAIETDSFAISTSYNEPNGMPLGAASDWLITPAIAIGANATFKWNAKVYDSPPYSDGYEIRIANAPTVAAMNAGTLLYSIAAESQNWTAHTASLAAYAGQTIYIAIHNNTNEGFLLGIDDLKVEGSLPVSTVAQTTDFCKMSVMPNPTTGAFQLKVNLETAQNLRIDIRNIQGQIIETIYHNTVLNDILTIESLVGQAAGVYYATLTTENGSVDTARIAVVK
jgi:hypothetical protein